ncbi:mobilization protein [Bifidobacterium hapali]|uniref:Mobilization protein n=2 Tax=Bifidobacterium TaxID=1678 RepID=A0A261FNW6_9BIFI|nr:MULTISPECIES: PcfB family protein [Bifidobacterium]OZG60880.1 mobilization protein [Bifidobacterium myosotis]OZG65317.1 mobilization protein [Bifidobacterium hapali]
MAAEDQAQELMMRVSEQGTRVIIDVTKYGLDKALHLLGIGVHATGETLRRIRTTGKVDSKTLHRTGEPINVQEVTGRYARQLEHDLKKAGITFHIEHDRDTGRTFLHFQGRDADEVNHVVSRIVERLNRELARQETATIHEPGDTDPVRPPTETTPDREESNPFLEPSDDALRLAFDAESPSNGRFDFRTVPWDRDAAIITDQLDRLHIPHHTQRVADDTVRFTYPAGQARRIADTIETLTARSRGLDWNRMDIPAPDGGVRRPKTKQQTLNDIHLRAGKRIEGQRRATPSKQRVRTR